MSMTKETFNVYYDALRTICKAHGIELIGTIFDADRFKVNFAGTAIKKPSFRYPIEEYISNWEPEYPCMMFDLSELSCSVHDLIRVTRAWFEDTLHLTTTTDNVNKIWEELLMKNFTKDDLRNGDFVIRRDGVKGVVIANTGVIVYQNGAYVNLDSYKTDLVCGDLESASELDIMNVYRGAKCFDCCEKFGTLVYDRESVEVEEMTLEQVCKALGKNIKIVKG